MVDVPPGSMGYRTSFAMRPLEPARKTVWPFLAMRQTWKPVDEINCQFMPSSVERSTPVRPQERTLWPPMYSTQLR